MFNFFKTILLIFFLGLLFLIPKFSLATAGFCPSFDITTPPFDAGLACLIVWIFYFTLSLSGVLLFTLLLINGIRYFFVFNNADQLKEIISNIKAAFLGVIILFLSVVIIRFINPEVLLLEVFKKADVEFELFLKQDIDGEERETSHKSIFFNPNPEKQKEISFDIYWKIESAAECRAFKTIPARATADGWEGEKASRANREHSTRVTIQHYHVQGSYFFSLRCYDEENLYRTRRVAIILMEEIEEEEEKEEEEEE